MHFPTLALEIFADRDTRPLAIVEQQRVFNVNDSAGAYGLEYGMALNTAHALCPGLLALERQPSREHEALQQLAHWVYRLTPDLAVTDDNDLLLEIGACRLLYGGIAPLLDLLKSGLLARGHNVMLGLAHTRKAAWLLARRVQPLALIDEKQAGGAQLDNELLRRQLGAMPIAALAIDRGIIKALDKMGIRTLNALTDLPLAALGKRFGAEFIRYLQQVLGTHPDPQPPFAPLPKFQSSLSFIDGIHNRQALLFPMRRLLQTFDDYLQSRQLLCTALAWELHDAYAPQAQITIELMRAEPASGQQRLRNLLELSELKLQNTPLRDVVYTLILRSEHFLPAQPQSFQLFVEEEKPEGSFAILIDKLRARLGVNALEKLSCRDVHWPESASVQQSIDTAGAAESSTRAALPDQLRPLWLLPKPQLLRERDKKLFWHCLVGAGQALQLLRGPERIGNHWWEQTYTARDYYVARAEDGRLCWVFRELSSDQWFVHGLFA
jgi:protein ImuB